MNIQFRGLNYIKTNNYQEADQIGGTFKELIDYNNLESIDIFRGNSKMQTGTTILTPFSNELDCYLFIETTKKLRKKGQEAASNALTQHIMPLMQSIGYHANTIKDLIRANS